MSLSFSSAKKKVTKENAAAVEPLAKMLFHSAAQKKLVFAALRLKQFFVRPLHSKAFFNAKFSKADPRQQHSTIMMI
ncbi:hypothetical protein [Flavilitoribacter nigricans]|uniref:hypothetical protein n=1 Tax=Flavilitoribacter nigricans TaxID=70997 RepID=UPI00117AEA49|nr:hypothetical protein [Flavilitoribacter nigricans]